MKAEIDLLPLLKDIEGIVYARQPCFYINWEIMTIPRNQQLVALANHPKGCSVAQIELWGCKDAEECVEFVRRNKHQIAVYKMFISFLHGRDFFVGYAIKPEAQLI